MNLLEIRNLKISFGINKKKTMALENVGFDIQEDEILGLVGESGSGKTVTGLSIMRILSKEAEIEGGSIKFAGEDLITLPETDMQKIRGSQIGMVFQEPFTSLNPVLRIGYQIEETLFIHKDMSKEEVHKKAMSLLRKVSIENPGRIFNAYPHQLSGGERQRAMIAMAIALHPKLLICDEPTTALDVTVQSGVLKLLRKLKEDLHISVLFITHDFAIVNEMADRVVVMKEGRVVETGTKTDILKNPKHPYTKELIEAVPKIGEEVISGMPSSKGDIFLETKSLNKSFAIEEGFLRREVSKVHAVKDLNITMEKGKTLGLVGESGCGKSTVAKLLLGLEEPDSGEILINGKTFSQVPDRRVREMMQIVFQDPYGSLDPRMRVEEIVLEGANLLRMRRPNRQSLLKDVLGRVRLSYEDRLKYPHQFSGGQRQRIAIARALLVNPEFLVLDEPVSSLDVLIQRDILTLLEELKKDMKLTYLFISHDLRVVESISDVISVMHKGEIVESGPKNEIYRRPKHPYTKHLLRSMPAF